MQSLEVIGDDLASVSGRSPWTFFALVFCLAIPFWVVGAMIERPLMPGLPVAALMTVCPALAALILARREGGIEGAGALLARAFDYRRIRSAAWLLPILLLAPGLRVLEFAALRLAGAPVPAPQIALLPTLGLCLVFFVAAIGEELGWSGYAIDPLQKRWGPLRASLLLGLIWALFHFVPLLQAHRSVGWIAWWSLGAVAMRVIIVWLYNSARRSVFAVALFHMTVNVTWQLFPVHGSYYDPKTSSLIGAAVAVLVAALRRPARR